MNVRKYAAVSVLYLNGELDTGCFDFIDVDDIIADLADWFDFTEIARVSIHCSWGIDYEIQIEEIMSKLRIGAL